MRQRSSGRRREPQSIRPHFVRHQQFADLCLDTLHNLLGREVEASALASFTLQWTNRATALPLAFCRSDHQSRAAPAVAFTTVPVNMRPRSEAMSTAAFAVSWMVACVFRKLD